MITYIQILLIVIFEYYNYVIIFNKIKRLTLNQQYMFFFSQVIFTGLICMFLIGKIK